MRKAVCCNKCRVPLTPDNRTRRGICVKCKKIQAAEYYQRRKEFVREQVRQHRKNNPEAVRDTELKKKFGISLNHFNEMLSQQGGVCAICEGLLPLGRWKTNFHVDHNHKTGKVRGLLCGSCNIGLGNFRHDPQRLAKALSYLCRADGLDPQLTELNWIRT